ncbi:MAG: 16S rRNA (cytosine(1402)-N(4))-methyltransferase RsmH [Oscillospiraceae bacterium]|nr:16S rRNA (cytosine(1402)-N(4))-methyltransferase RsmH [Oscillospiraceae bacterium]
MVYKHTTVLLRETIDYLAIKPDGHYVDCTLGGGGHSAAIADKLDFADGGKLTCFDMDIAAINAARANPKLSKLSGVTLIHGNFSELAGHELQDLSGIVMDLGVSSHQLDTPERGFSFHDDAPLDMRMGDSAILTAYDVVNDYSEGELTRILYEYGEEKYAKSIARGIVRARGHAPLKTTGELAEVIKQNVPLSYRNAKNPCRKAFQAIRIEVNDELGSLTVGLQSGFAALSAGGRFAVITFHSLEDRLVKRTFAEFTAGCDCPKSLPLCVCGKTPRAIQVTRKPVEPSAAEIEGNRRARSAKLRVIEKLKKG